MNNREIIEKVIEAFDRNDVESILSYLTEDAEWHMLGEHIIKGKEEWKKFFEANAGTEMLSSSKHHIIVDGDKAAVDGEASCKVANGQTHNMYYCDIYELEAGKIKKLFSYIVNKKK